ncbi:MAG: protein TolQ, partial [Arenimonas sp.]|nr:protein TolQ [Arenimonas sp.]
MSPATALILAAAPVTELPVEAVPAAADAAAASSGAGLSYLQLMLHASLPVQLIVLLLLLGSVLSWVIIFRKNRVYSQATDEADEFESRFWSGVDLTQLYRSATDRNRVVSGLEAIFEAGFREFARLRQKKGLDGRTQLEGAQRAMRATFAREVDRLEHNLELLANIGSTAPYVGLVGTVFG